MSIKITGDAEEKKYMYKKNTLTRITREEQTKHIHIRRKTNQKLKSLDLMEKVNQMKMYFVVDMLIMMDQKEDDDHYQID
jgi:hypothetical protein